MKERPILFNAEMVRAILDGRKTQTRRVIKLTDNGLLRLRAPYATWLEDGVGPVWCPYGGSPKVPMPADRLAAGSPYGVPGDRLWVRETWSIDPSEGDVTYEADGETARFLDLGAHGAVGIRGKHPSIFMPRALSRITLEVTGVRVERVQDISGEDAGAEGTPCIFCRKTLVTRCQCALDKADYHEDFQKLWDSVNAKRGYSWESNPWVWVVSFKQLD